jgi:hypothetical protein
MATPAILPVRLRSGARALTSAAAAAICVWLAYSSLDVVRIHRESGDLIAWGIPVWVVVTFMPMCFLAIACRLIWSSSARRSGKLLCAAGLIVLVLFALSAPNPTELRLPLLFAIALLAALGMPIFASLGGAALVLFWSSGMPTSVSLLTRMI